MRLTDIVKKTARAVAASLAAVAIAGLVTVAGISIKLKAQGIDLSPLLLTLEQFYGPPGQHVQGSSANVANASAVATLAAAAGKLTYISHLRCMAGGSTAAQVSTITVAGLVTSEIYQMVAVAGVTLANTPVDVVYTPPMPASAINTAITVTMAALGAGNTNASCTAHGFQQ